MPQIAVVARLLGMRRLLRLATISDNATHISHRRTELKITQVKG